VKEILPLPKTKKDVQDNTYEYIRLGRKNVSTIVDYAPRE
jgi:hypothetical protein